MSTYPCSNFQQVRDRPAEAICVLVGKKMDEKLCASSYLELCLKIGEPPTEDENFLRSVIIFPQLIAPIVILLGITATG
jgi:hypothetical protein